MCLGPRVYLCTRVRAYPWPCACVIMCLGPRVCACTRDGVRVCMHLCAPMTVVLPLLGPHPSLPPVSPASWCLCALSCSPLGSLPPFPFRPISVPGHCLARCLSLSVLSLLLQDSGPSLPLLSLLLSFLSPNLSNPASPCPPPSLGLSPFLVVTLGALPGARCRWGARCLGAGPLGLEHPLLSRPPR